MLDTIHRPPELTNDQDGKRPQPLPSPGVYLAEAAVRPSVVVALGGLVLALLVMSGSATFCAVAVLMITLVVSFTTTARGSMDGGAILVGEDPQLDGAGRATLLVTAHPDDECMFFTPAVIYLSKAGAPLHVLCLSTGNYDGLGAARATELMSSCARLGVPPERVTVLDDARLQDGPRNAWPSEHVAAVVRHTIEARRIARVVTFDDWGVSGHPNHGAVSAGVRRMLADDDGHSCGGGSGGPALPVGTVRPVRVYELESKATLRKLASVWDIGPSLLELCARRYARRAWHALRRGRYAPASDGRCCCVALPGPWRCHAAMREHQSQYVWYRRLYVLFSSYAIVNTLRRV